MGEAVIVTGANGRIGAAACRHFEGRRPVVALQRAGHPPPSPGAEVVEVDLASDAGVAEGLARVRARHGGEVASVLHFAAFYEFDDRPDPRYEEVNVRGSARLLRGLGEAGLRADQFVYASTMVVHAPGEPGRPTREDSPLGPALEYARSKLRAEGALRAVRGETPLVVLRIANVYDDRGGHPVLAQHVRRIYQGRPTTRFFPGDPARGQSYLHLDDLLDALDRIVDRRGTLPPELTLLLGEPDPVGYGEIARVLSRALRGGDRPPIRVPKALARLGARLLGLVPGSDPFVKPWMVDRADDHYEIDPARARETLGWTPRHAFRETLAAIAEDVRADPEGWFRDNDLGDDAA